MNDIQVREQIAEVLDLFDDLLIDGKFEECNIKLQEYCNKDNLPSAVLVAILGITCCANLPSRPKFYDKAFREVTALKGRRYAKELLTRYKEPYEETNRLIKFSVIFILILLTLLTIGIVYIVNRFIL